MCEQSSFSLSFIVIIVCSLFTVGSLEVYTSVMKMELLAQTEDTMLKHLGTYIEDNDHDGIVVQEGVKMFYSRALEEHRLTNDQNFMLNPINCFHFIKRMYHGWTNILNEIKCDDCLPKDRKHELKFNENINKLNNESLVGVLATEQDYHGTAMALVRLWQTYKLDLRQLYRGVILNTTTNPLSTEDVFDICGILDEKNKIFNQIKWLENLKGVLLDANQENGQCVIKVIKRLASAYTKYGWPWVSIEMLEYAIAKDPNNKSLKRDLPYYKMKLDAIPEAERRLTNLTADQVDIDKAHYEALCRGDVTRPIALISRLRCFYRNTKIPIYRVKEEVFNIDPRVSVFYDVTTDAQREHLKALVIPALATSTVVGVHANYRISQTAWISDRKDAQVQHISKNVEIFTGLSTRMSNVSTHAEEMQILNYGIGGMYEKHTDFLETGYATQKEGIPEMLNNAGDRVATWMFYLSDVYAGGATVYTKMNITVPPIKGSAAFWFNIKRNGDLDFRTEHAGCPVLLGSKWVANKWIREGGQIFRRKCGLRQDAIDLYRPNK